MKNSLISYTSSKKSKSRDPEGHSLSSAIKQYDKELEDETYDLELLYRMYYKEPVKHPKYREEWNKFWDHRASVLKKNGYTDLEIKNYEFTHEWRDFFLNRLKVLKNAEYVDLKQFLAKKYLMDKRSSTRSSSSSERSYRRSSERKYRKSSDRSESSKSSKKSSHKTKKSRQTRSRSVSVDSKRQKERRSRSVTPKYTKLKPDVPTPISVISVCRALLHLDNFVTFNRTRVSDLLDKAQSEQVKNNREYLMNKFEGEFVKNLNSILLNTLMLKRISTEIADDIKLVRIMIMDLLARWLKFYNELKPPTTFLEDIMKEENVTPPKTLVHPQTATNLSPNHKPVAFKFNKYKALNSHFADLNSWKKPVTIKAEPVAKPKPKPNLNNSEILKLIEEKNQILKKIYEESDTPYPFNLCNNSQGFSSTVNSSDDCKVAIKQESLSIAHEISDEQLIECLSELESLSEEKQQMLLKIMSEIENTDSERFDRLKGYIFDE